jgi:hypothetical protein
MPNSKDVTILTQVEQLKRFGAASQYMYSPQVNGGNPPRYSASAISIIDGHSGKAGLTRAHPGYQCGIVDRVEEFQVHTATDEILF